MHYLPSRPVCRQSTMWGILVFFFNDTATTEIYPLSLHDALPIYGVRKGQDGPGGVGAGAPRPPPRPLLARRRSEEHTSELQSQSNLVCRLLLEKKKTSGTYLLPTRARACAHARSDSRNNLC